MKKRILASVASALWLACMQGEPLTVCDFENYDVGTVFTMWNIYGGTPSSTATVETDPANPNNKVLHVRLKEWNCYPELVLPTDLRGTALTDRYTMVKFDLYRSADDANDYKQCVAFLGPQELYRSDGFPFQGDKLTWQSRSYDLLPAEVDNVSDRLRLGIHSNESDYYIDNIKLAGTFDSFTWLNDGERADHCVNNTSSSYTTISTDYYIPEGVSASVTASRYSQWTGKIAGGGEMNILAGGERVYIGTQSSKGSTYPDWTGMTGTVNILPYKDVIATCGFYGIILNSGTFQPENLEASNANRLFTNARVCLKPGARIAAESGTRGMRIGQLDTEEGSILDSYYKSGSAKTYYVIGGTGADSRLAGTVAPQSSGNYVGIIKEGAGRLTVSGIDNNINGGVRVLDGTFAIDNNVPTTGSQSNGAIGATGTLYVFGKGTLAGRGVVGKLSDVYGSISPGDDTSGSLWFGTSAAGSANAKLTLHPKAKVICTLHGAGDYSSIKVGGTLAFSDQTEDFETSDRHPRLYISLADGAEISEGDTFTLIEATTTDGECEFDIRFPKLYTWAVEQGKGADGSFRVIARVESLKYSGQGDIEDDDDEEGDDNGDYADEDWSVDRNDPNPLRHYASLLNKSIGVAVGTYRYDCSTDEDACGLVGKEFNLVVAENEMKFDATEPERGKFTYGGADAVMWVASRNSQEVRGHTLAWYSQVSPWVSSDGKKNDKGFTKSELLEILKNHIFNVVGNYKGRIREWDVCNEVLDDDQSALRSNPSGYTLRPSIWATYIGEEYIDSAFVWAHQADPGARLFINDYGVEFAGNSKAEAYFNLVKRLKDSGLPIDGCGLQCHLTTGQLDTLRLEKNIARYATIGLDCIITELDIAMAQPTAPGALDVQAKEYAAITRVFLRNDNCPTMLLWGISDNNSWRSNSPLLFDRSLNPKPAYYAVHAQLRNAVENDPSSIVDIFGDTDCEAVSIIYYDLFGRIISSPVPGSLVIEKRIYPSGRSTVTKRVF